MTPHLIIEGPDGSGKSHLIDRVITQGIVDTTERVGALTDAVLGPLSAAEFYRQKLWHPDAIAFDRFYLSELIYGPMLRPRSAISEGDLRLVRLQFPAVKTIVCLPSEGVCYLATRSRPWPDYQTDPFLTDAYAAWTRIADSEFVDFVYDWTQPTGAQLRPSKGIPMPLLFLR